MDPRAAYKIDHMLTSKYWSLSTQLTNRVVCSLHLHSELRLGFYICIQCRGESCCRERVCVLCLEEVCSGP